ncbi:MAG TPA: Npt1/Npt2 family nucleotide transporter, partial [Myxococcaceae bacterium]|nr:Npt1/Npt2 family nucleotide transporter [Myxococcaceae bacterium]
VARAEKIMSSGAPRIDREGTVTSTVPHGLRVLRHVVDVQPAELRPALLGCLYFFLLFTSYFILRPIRDELAVSAGVSKLPWLFAGTLSAMLLCNPLFSALVVRFPVKRFIVISYQFFAFNLLAFFLLSRTMTGTAEVWLGRVFFVWTAVFNLFAVSIFWALMSDSFRSEEAKRLYGFIGLGGTLGSIVGSATTALLARSLGSAQLMLVSALLLEMAILVVLAFPNRAALTDGVRKEQTAATPIGGSVWAGVTGLVRSPYLIAIAAFLLLYTLGSTVLYFEQTDVIGRFFKTREARTEILARMEFGTQLLAALTQIFLTGRIIRWIGLAATLALVPTVSILGFIAMGATSLGITPLLGTFVVFSVLRRGSNFALTHPAREVLFTVVSREERFKAKSLIDTFVYRAGDQIAAWTYAGLVALGLTLTGIAWAAVPMCIAFLALGLWLGRKQSELAAETSALRAS